ncbi:MAG: hypothetical protein CMJ58_23555 [Planctomycetaceae bacterium]|nr:hypothetical protein [Planctomycetaceae bacterium]
MRTSRRISLLRRVSVLALAIGCLTGCGGEQGDLAVAGKVTLDGAPVPQGTIVLSSGGAAATGAIENGRFQIAAEKGLAPGTYHVRIVAYELTGKQVPDNEFPDRTIPERRQIIPERYNDQSELQVNVAADTASSLEFALESK